MASDKALNIKTKVAFDGEAEYKSACKDIGQTLKVLNSEMKLLMAEQKANGTSIDTLKSKQETLKRTYDEQKRKVEETTKALEKCKEEIGEDSEETKKLESSLNYAKIALVNTEAAIKKTADEMEELENATDEAGDEIEDTEKKSGKLGETMGGAVVAGLKAAAVAAAAAMSAIAAIGAASIKVGAEFETSMAKTSTLFTGTDEEFKKLNDDILNISASTGLAASGLAEAAYSAESAGVAQENLATMLEQSAHLAAAGFTDVETALSATAKTMNAYGDKAGSIEEIQKVLIQTQNLGITTVGELGQSLAQVTPTAAAFGVSFDQVGAALAGMTAQGTPTATATAQLNTLIAELGKEGTKASTKFRELTGHIQDGGLSFAEAMEQGWNLADVLSLFDEEAYATGKSMVDMFSSIEAGKAALSIFGSDFEGNLAEMSTDVDVVTQGFEKMMDTFEAKGEVFKTTAQNLGISIYQNMQEPLKEIADVGISSLTQLQEAFSTGGFQGMIESLGGVIAELLAKITEAAPMMAKSAVTLLDGFVGALVEQIPTITAAATDIVIVLIDGIVEMLPTLIEGAAQIILSLAQGIAQALPTLLPTIVSVITEIVTMLIDNIPMLIDAAMQLLKGLADGLVAAIPVLVQSLPQIIQSIVTAIVESLPIIIASAGDIIVALIDGLIQAIPLLVEATPQIIAAIVMGLIEGLPQILEAAGELVITIITKLGELPGMIAEAIADGIARVAQWGAQMQEKGREVITEFVAKIIELAKELPGKIWNAIVTAVTKIAQWGQQIRAKGREVITNFVNSIIQIAKELPGKIWNAIIGAVQKVAEWGRQIKEKAVAGMKAVVEGIKSVFSNIGETFLSFGKNMVEGIWNGINGATQWIKDKISGWVGNVTDFLKKLFGIESPSKLMRDEVGVYLAKGIGVGFALGMKDVKEQIEQSIPREFDVQTKTNFRTAAGQQEAAVHGSGARAAGGVNVNVVQNIYADKTDYAGQQREAARQMKQVARMVFA